MKKRNKWLSGVLASSLVLSQIVTTIPMSVIAAPERAVADGVQQERAVVEMWRQFKSSTKNDNGNNAAILVNTNKGTEGMEAGEISFVLKPNGDQATTRFNVGPWITDNGHYMTIGYNATGWFYEYKGAGNSYPGISEFPTPPAAGEEMAITIKWNQRDYTVTAGGVEKTFQIPEEAYNGLKAGKLGFRIGSYSNQVTDILFKDVEIKDGEGNVIVVKGTDTWELQTKDSGEVFNAEVKNVKAVVSGKVVDKDGKPVEGAEVALGTATVTTKADGTYTFNDIATGTYTVSATKDGYQAGTAEVIVEEDDVTVKDIVLVKGSDAEFEGDDTLVSDQMVASISNTFPQVIGYTMKGGENDGKKFYGQTKELTQLKVNGKLVTPTVDYKKESDSKAVYTMNIDEQDIKATVTAALEVKDNTLSFDITKIDAAEGTFLTVEIPNHNLVTVKSNQSGAAFDGANMSTNTTKSGDTHSTVSALSEAKRGYMYAFVSNDELSAGLWSNSENNVTADWQRVTEVTQTVDGVKETGLSSTYWTYQKSAEHRIENEAYEMPSTKVVITGDENDDDTVNWQDGAIAYRSIMNNSVGSELVPDRVAIRIAMNFNSHAQNPFLMTYDNAQKVYLNTDGLGQSILLKGYGSEGHDSGHLNYADVGRRIGGVEEMKKLLAQGKEIGATFGIHVNASETYPESKYFEEDRLMKDKNGNLSYGWNWLDQGVNINADYDLRHGREQRFIDLYNALGGEDNDLDFIYVDVWGNGQSGDNGTWASRQLAKEITQTCGWRLGSEWGHANEYDSTFQHWAADLTYGGATSKGINSEITRFIRNHQKDSWVGDYPSYGGAAVEPLLGGYDMKDFEGWQGRNDYKGYIENLFDDNLATKFLQHYKVMKWVDGEPTTVGGAAWTPEKEITLQDDAKENTVVVTRKSTDGASEDYKHRIMTFNGRTIMDGEKYLIPWFWDANGKELAAKDEKLYHWNQAGGTSTWDLPEGWEGAKLYQLTETGNVECSDRAAISGGKITINAEAKVPYVLHKAGAGEGIKATDLTWSKGAHLVDTGFNSNTLEHWTIKGNDGAKIVWSAANNMMLEVGSESEEVTLTQTLTDLEPGKGYAAYVGVDNRSDAKAYIEVSVDGKVISNYTEKSIAKNYLQSYAHNTNNATIKGGGSYFQNMYVFFTAPEDGKEVTLTLKREKGAGKTYFDDVRVVNNQFGETETDGNFNPFVSENKLEQTFEAVPQGLFPFVIGNVEGVTDNRTHLSEIHEPYTQSGWYGVKKLDDVLNGDWSVKTNGLTGAGRLLYQTIPQNFRFKEGVTYNISFKYEMGSENTYAFAVGNGESNGSNFETYELEKADLNNAEPKTFKFRLTGKPGDQSWIGIYSTTTPADTGEAGGNEANFGGYKDFVLDDLVIQVSKAQKGELEELVAANNNRYEVNYTAESWKVFADAMAAANAALDDFEAEQATVDTAKANLEKAIKDLDVIGITLSGKATDESGAGLSDITISVENGKDKVVSTKTDANGNYVLPGVLFGEKTVVAESNIFATNQQKITASEEKLEETLNFTMKTETTRVEGKVTAVGEPVEGATVTIGDKTTTTDAEGNYAIDEVVTKVYTVKVEKEGYDVLSKEVVVSKGDKVVANFMLSPLTREEADYENNYDDGVKTWDNLAGNTASTTITMVDGQTKIIFPGGHANVYETEAPQFKNGVVEMDITSDKPGIRIGLLLRAKDMNNRVYVGVGDAANKYFAEHWGKGGNAWTSMHDGPTFAAGQKMHLKAEIVDKTIKLWVNEELVLTETMSGIPMDAGCIGINTRNNHTIYVDNVKVTSYDLPTGDLQNVAGRVVDGQNQAIEGAKVELLDNNGKALKATTTDTLGNYKFKNVVVGEYSVKATAGELSKEVSVTVVTGEDYVVVDKIVLGEVVDKALLEFAIQYAEEQMADERYPDVIPAVREAYEKAYKAAKAVYENPAATKEEVESAYWALAEAGQKLNWYKGDLTDLQAAYDMYEGKDLSIYTEDTRKALEEALKEAKEILDLGENAVKELVDAALEKLNAAIEGLELIPVDKSKLQQLVNDAKQYEDRIEEYTPKTAEEFMKMLEAAREVLNTDPVSQTTIDSAYVALQQAIFELRLIPNKDKLEDLINKVEKTDLSGYTAKSVKALKAALSEAKAVMADPEADQKSVDQAVQVLQEKFDGLVAVGEETKADKDELKALIDKTEKMELKPYTVETALAVRNALKEAKAIYDDKDATQQEVDATLAKLQKALDGLKKSDVQKTEDDKKPGATNNKKSAKTGDVALPIGWAFAGVGAVLAVVAAFFARRRKNH